MKRVGRNDPCPCGSGKKYKNCCRDKFPREQFVYIGYKEPFQGVTIDGDQVFVHLLSGEKVKADAVFSQRQYKKISGKDKVTSSIPNRVVVDIPYYLASRFDVILAIDTNTKQIGNDLVSISCVFECYAKQINATQLQVSYRKHGNMAFRNCPNGEAERFAWSRLVMMVTSDPRYNEKLRVALITDHGLSRLAKYNTRELPIYQNFFLPSNFTLIYASSDIGKDNVLNALLIECEKDASSMFNQLEEKGSITIGNSIITIDKMPDLKAKKTTTVEFDSGKPKSPTSG
jgi:hypothetical protein